MLRITKVTQPDGSVTIQDPPIAQFLFGNTKMAVVWLVVRLYVGLSWLEAGLHKVFKYTAPENAIPLSFQGIHWGQLNEGWMITGGSILGYWKGAVAVPPTVPKAAITYDWFRVFLQYLIDIQAHTWMGQVIAIGETLVGLGLIVGAFVGVAAFFGAFMNLNFMLAGTTSSNPVLFGLAVLLMLGWKVAGYWGLDRVLLPVLGTPWRGRTVATAPAATPLPPSTPPSTPVAQAR
jgi:thiosulfate dehydrogenase [quinone] large subunit